MADVTLFFNYFVIFITLYFEVFLLISLLEKKQNLWNDEEEYTPPVTIVVPCYNEEKTIAGTLDSLLALDYPRDMMRIMVIDDGSTDGSQNALLPYKDNPIIEVYKKENGGKYTALNFAIEKCTTPFIGCLDADSFVMPGALRRIVAEFKDPKTMAVTPSMVIHTPNTFIQKLQKSEYNYGNFTRKLLAQIGSLHVTPGPFSFFRTEVFDKVGGYRHAHNTEDMEMAMRLQKHGLKIANAEGALVYTVGPDTFKKLYKQRVRWVGGFIGNIIDYRHMVFNRKYGDLGLVVLPFTIFSTTISIGFVLINLWRILHKVWEHIIRFQTIGFSWPKFGEINWFFFNTSAFSMLAIFSIILSVYLIHLGQKMATGKWTFSFEAIYFILLYGSLTPIWLIKAIYNNIIGKDASWR